MATWLLNLDNIDHSNVYLILNCSYENLIDVHLYGNLNVHFRGNVDINNPIDVLLNFLMKF